jgi:MFS family permease
MASSETSPAALLRIHDFRWLLVSIGCTTLASRALAVVIGYQVYDLTKNPFSLGMLGLVEAIPALSLALYGGHVADRHDRRSVLRWTLGVLVLCALCFAGLVALTTHGPSVYWLYAVVFIAGIARGFAEPAASAIEAQVVPVELLMQASTWFASSWLACSILGPLIGGTAYGIAGPAVTYVLIALLFANAWGAVTFISPRPPTPAKEDESIWQSIAIGVRYVASDQVLVSSMALDLFAVLFGGAIALLPVFAADILHVGPFGVGVLNAAPNAGALLTMLIAMRHPPARRAGTTLLAAVAAFGVCIIVFAFSSNFLLSAIALFFSGVFDGISIVIRRAIVRLLSPDHLRGRIAAVSMVFIGSSNELGALESGVAAGWLGTRRAVWLGGAITLAVVGLTAFLAPRLRSLDLSHARNTPAK